MTADPDTIVAALLAAAGLPASESEVAHLVGAYPRIAAQVRALHSLIDARYEEPATVFTALVPTETTATEAQPAATFRDDAPARPDVRSRT